MLVFLKCFGSACRLEIEFVATRSGRSPALSEPADLIGAVSAATRGLLATAEPVGTRDELGTPLEAEYVYGGLPAAAVVLGIVALIGAPRRAWKPAVLLVVTLGLAWDPVEGPQLSLFTPLRRLPLFGSMRETSRYVSLFAVLWASLLAGVGFEELLRFAASRGARTARIVGLVVITALVPQAIRTAALYRATFTAAPSAMPERPDSFEYVNLFGTPPLGVPKVAHYVYQAPQSGIGVLYRAEDLPEFPEPPISWARELHLDGTFRTNSKYWGNLRFLDGAGEAANLVPEPNRLTFDVRTDGPATVLVNQRHHPDWTGPDGLEIFPHDRLIGVRFPAEFEGKVELRFRPWGLLRGAALSAMTVGLSLVVLLRLRRRRRPTN
jgi:hypothetical protein